MYYDDLLNVYLPTIGPCDEAPLLRQSYQTKVKPVNAIIFFLHAVPRFHPSRVGDLV